MLYKNNTDRLINIKYTQEKEVKSIDFIPGESTEVSMEVETMIKSTAGGAAIFAMLIPESGAGGGASNGQVGHAPVGAQARGAPPVNADGSQSLLPKQLPQLPKQAEEGASTLVDGGYPPKASEAEEPAHGSADQAENDEADKAQKRGLFGRKK